MDILNEERHKLELYVAEKERKFDARESALEKKVNKTFDELAKITSELKLEKAKVTQLELAIDQLTVQIFNLTTSKNELQAKLRELQSRNSDLENEMIEIKRNYSHVSTCVDGQDLRHNVTVFTCPKIPTLLPIFPLRKHAHVIYRLRFLSCKK